MFYNKNDPLVDSVKKVMEQNERERQAAAAVNNAFGITSRKALPHERQHEWDTAYKKVLTEGVEVLEDYETKDGTTFKRKKSMDFPKESDKVHKNTVRALKRIKEEEEQLDELSRKTLKSYIKKADSEYYDLYKKAYNEKDPKKKAQLEKKRDNRMNGQLHADDRLEEGLKMNDYGHSKEVNKKKRLAKILKHRMGKGDGKESVEQSRREDK